MRKPPPLDRVELRNLLEDMKRMRNATEALVIHVSRHPSDNGDAERAVLSLRMRIAEKLNILKDFEK